MISTLRSYHGGRQPQKLGTPRERIGQDPRQSKGDPANAGNGSLAVRSASNDLVEL